MTQSGRGEEPSARPAREGIVLPSDGGEPLLPGMTGGPADAHAGRPSAGGPQPSAPAEGQTWGQPWGPDQETPPPPPGQSWQAPPAQQWTEPPAWGAPGPGALPEQPPNPYGAPAGGVPLPPEGAGPAGGPDAYGTPASGAPGGYGPAAGSGAYGPAAGGGPQPSAADPYNSPAGDGSLPPHAGSYGSPAGHGMPPGPGAYGPAAGGGSQPHGQAPAGAPQGAHGAAAGAPLPAAYDEGATQYLPPVRASADEGATQYIPPVGPGALPPEMPAAQDPEATTFLGTGPRAGAGPMPPASNPDAEATQYIPPVTGGDQQPPAGFENLFRGERGTDSPAGATQQMPRIEQPPPSYGAPQPSYDPHDEPRGGRSGRGGRGGSRVPVIAAVGIGIAVLGVGAGAMLAGGGGGEDDGGDKKTVAASAPATDDSASPSADPARAQAVELDKLLADSGDSRSTVINAVADVKGCDNLAQAARNLRDAARQRTDLVTRLSGITVDKLPDHAALTTALTKAWQASASADNHYAAWADQTAGKKGCRKGQARVTGQTQAGNRASGVASTEKAKAAGLWNGIAKRYGLTERQPTQL
ncbi:hypothetical protein [Streptomyces djakartensis]|uniref:Uncharacterized protein n=1 Tax=Streptomyces djakartensis TaxID=68193 RepID=A0ABQ2ZXV3_9ACTN|nr:hypothetical protein [Streptomyces djakartensis]GGY26557.1 hypothetical protein GCM10010384_37020 [Streptomyces djakartensis]